MNNEQVKHTVKIDDHISIDLLIPIVMDSVTFKAIMQKANSLFKISGGIEVETLSSDRKEKVYKPEHYPLPNKYPLPEKKTKTRDHKTDIPWNEIKKYVVKNYPMNVKVLANKFNVHYTTMYSKIQEWKKQNILKVKA